MVDLTGKLVSISYAPETGQPRMVFEIEGNSVWQVADKLFKAGRLALKVDKYREKYSMNALSYLWVLCGKIADKLSEDGYPHTKDGVYQQAVKAVGIYRVGELQPDFANTMRKAWERLGTGWITEQVDFAPGGELVTVRFYYGCSTYNSKQMSRLIDWLVVECTELGIETKTAEEINSLLKTWEEKYAQSCNDHGSVDP